MGLVIQELPPHPGLRYPATSVATVRSMLWKGPSQGVANDALNNCDHERP